MIADCRHRITARGDTPDGRRDRPRVGIPTALAGLAVITAIILAFLVEVSRGHDGSLCSSRRDRRHRMPRPDSGTPPARIGVRRPTYVRKSRDSDCGKYRPGSPAPPAARTRTPRAAIRVDRHLGPVHVVVAVRRVVAERLQAWPGRVASAFSLLRLPGGIDVARRRAGESNFVVTVGVDHIDVAVPGSVCGVGDRAPVGSPGQGAPLDGTRRVARQPMVVASVGTASHRCLRGSPCRRGCSARRETTRIRTRCRHGL